LLRNCKKKIFLTGYLRGGDLKFTGKTKKTGFILISPSNFFTPLAYEDKQILTPFPKRARIEHQTVQELIDIANQVPSKGLGKRVSFNVEKDVRLFLKNQSPVSFTTEEELDASDPLLMSDLNYEKCSEKDFARFKGCDIQKELSEKKKWDKLFSYLSETPFDKEAFKNRFSSLYNPVYFSQELYDRLRDLCGKNEIDYDLKEVIKRAFIPFFFSTKKRKEGGCVINEVNVWLETMLLAPIYQPARILLLELLPEMETFYSNSISRISNILDPSTDDQSASFQISRDFWVRFLGRNPSASNSVYELFEKEHPIALAIDLDMQACAQGQGLEKALALEAYTVFCELLEMKNFECVASYANIHQLLMLVFTPLKDHFLIKRWKDLGDFSEVTIPSLDTLEIGLKRNYLDHVLSCPHPIAQDLKNRILFEYALHKIGGFPKNISQKGFQKALIEAVESCPLMNTKTRLVYDFRPFYEDIFCDSGNFLLIKRFWYSLFQKFPDLKKDPNFLTLYELSIQSHSKETTRPD
jgi:hypothetical protein